MDPNAEEPAPIVYVGQHESQREVPVNSQLLGDAQSLGYDLLTAPITTTHFQSRVLTILADYVKLISESPLPGALPLPNISPLAPKDTDLSPEDSTSALIAVASPWIDLGSKDPLIAHISRQVVNAEVAYAAFVGISSILVQGPVQGSDVAQYSRAILEALSLGPYVQLHIVLPMTGELEMEGFDGEHLSELARKQYVVDEDEDDDGEPEPFGSWETWDAIRSICSYSNKLTVGMLCVSSSYFSFTSFAISRTSKSTISRYATKNWPSSLHLLTFCYQHWRYLVSCRPQASSRDGILSPFDCSSSHELPSSATQKAIQSFQSRTSNSLLASYDSDSHLGFSS